MRSPILTYSPGGGVTRGAPAILTFDPGEAATDPGTPILNWQPSGGVSIPEALPEPLRADGESGVTQLIQGQSWIDVAFASPQLSKGWTFVECQVVNTEDEWPLNIWPGIVTVKTKTGFKLQLNGEPDSSSYYLFWTIIPPVPVGAGVATTYLFTGPASGALGAPASFTVQLIAGQTVDDIVVVTLDDDGDGGTFTPPTLQLSTGTPSVVVTYTPVSYGPKVLSVTNDGGLTDPAPRDFLSAAGSYTLSGPTSAYLDEMSALFTVALPTGGPIPGSSVIVTPTDQPDASTIEGVFTPTFVSLTNAVPFGTFGYTPATGPTKTIRTTNNGGLTNPPGLAITVTFNPGSITGLIGWWKADALFALADGTPISTWPDGSSAANHATQTGAARPVFKTNILNGQPAVRFSSAGVQQFMVLTIPIHTGSLEPWTVFVVQKHFDFSSDLCALGSVTPSVGDCAVLIKPFGSQSTLTAAGHYYNFGADATAFHIFTANTTPAAWVDGVTVTLNDQGVIDMSSFSVIGYSVLQEFFSNGHIAEILIYNSVLGSTDRSAVEGYLALKYGL